MPHGRLPARLTAVFGQHIMETDLKGAFGVSIPYSRTFLFGIPWYSVLIVLGVICAIWLSGREEKRLGLPQDTVIDLALTIIPCGIVGARLYYVLMSWESFAHDPVSVLYVWQGGVAIYGAVIGGAIGAFFYARRKKLSFLTLADIIVPGLLLAQAIGRWGNYFNMEAYGPVIENPALRFFPLGVQIFDGTGWQWHMATFFYESMWNLWGFIALWRLRKGQRHPGSLLCWYMLIYGSGRFVIEQLRQDSLMIGSLKASQYLSLILCGIGASVLLWQACRDRRSLSGRCLPPCLAAAAAAIARWFAVGRPLPYLLLTAVVLLCTLWLMLAAGSRISARNAAAVPLIVLDILCLQAAASHPSDQMLHFLHALVCSAAIPLLIRLLIRIVDTGKAGQSTEEEREPCPSES